MDSNKRYLVVDAAVAMGYEVYDKRWNAARTKYIMEDRFGLSDSISYEEARAILKDPEWTVDKDTPDLHKFF